LRARIPTVVLDDQHGKIFDELLPSVLDLPWICLGLIEALFRFVAEV
jgi:hypothetical protein